MVTFPRSAEANPEKILPVAAVGEPHAWTLQIQASRSLVTGILAGRAITAKGPVTPTQFQARPVWPRPLLG